MKILLAILLITPFLMSYSKDCGSFADTEGEVQCEYFCETNKHCKKWAFCERNFCAPKLTIDHACSEHDECEGRLICYKNKCSAPQTFYREWPGGNSKKERGYQESVTDYKD